MFWKKKIRCEHDWHELRIRKDCVYHWPNWIDVVYVDMYCPKCDRLRVELESEWLLIKEAQRIRTEYQLK